MWFFLWILLIFCSLYSLYLVPVLNIVTFFLPCLGIQHAVIWQTILFIYHQHSLQQMVLLNFLAYYEG